MRIVELTHRFVEFLPDELEDGVLYISIPYATVEHKCCSGCGQRVTTPLSPTDWSLTFDGKTVSLRPSIGNWNFQCQSHYWITRSRVEWAPRMSRAEIEAGRARDRAAKSKYFGRELDAGRAEVALEESVGLWGRIKGWFSRNR